MGHNGVIPRAIRCNRKHPCSNCITSSLVCQPTSNGNASSPASSPTTQVDALHQRLSTLESAFQSLAAQHNAPILKIPATQLATTPPAVPRKGDSSFDRLAYAASQVPELSYTTTSAVAKEVNELLSTITSGEASHLDKRCPGDAKGQRWNGDAKMDLQMDLVPSDFVASLFRTLRDSESLLFLFHPIHDLAQLEALCQHVYFPVDPLTTGQLTVFHGALYFALFEQSQSPTPHLDAEQVQQHLALCWHNFEAGLGSHELFAVASYENTLALAMGALDARIKGQVALQWNYTTAAARHCLTLGYHRSETMSRMPAAESESRLRLFWHVYMSDSGLSLSLGRASLIQEWDIDAPPVTISKLPTRIPWDRAFAALVHFSVLKARIFKQLYSPRARLIDNAQRCRIVAELVEKLAQWYVAWQRIDFTDAHYSRIIQAASAGVDVTYFSVLTLLHRGINSSTAVADISAECFEAARRGLEAHLAYYPHMVDQGPCAEGLYATWILLFSSFTPFIVTFLHCIGHSDVNDLQLLARVVETIEHMAGVVTGCQRQSEICKALYHVAETFVGSRAEQQLDQGSVQPGQVLNLSLQSPMSGGNEWMSLETTLDGWSGQQLNADFFTLGSRLDSPIVHLASI
ncbi:hypothetical protein CDD82_4129 [Ophiocordyceps australis]|uniref:Xylanolytic transcriptional activator regulatory domain-containing protein n=1 Tax=Ophiocordyceps australis TaxID=1399860 RepID=A0A2C5Z8E7_9HYPO|nr:hypothetical protein CDD82_4129 [Ophiocordyceps australis]